MTAFQGIWKITNLKKWKWVNSSGSVLPPPNFDNWKTIDGESVVSLSPKIVYGVQSATPSFVAKHETMSYSLNYGQGLVCRTTTLNEVVFVRYWDRYSKFWAKSSLEASKQLTWKYWQFCNFQQSLMTRKIILGRKGATCLWDLVYILGF